MLLGGVPLDELPLDSARTAVLVQDKDPVLLSGTLRELLDVPVLGRRAAPRRRWPPRSAATCWTRSPRGRWTPGPDGRPASPNAAAPCRAASASVSRWPGR